MQYTLKSADRRRGNSTWSSQSIKANILKSNSDSAYRNRNIYLIQEQASLDELYDQIPCPCEESCSCRKYGCTTHWKFKDGIDFPQFRDAFLRMFADSCCHDRVIEYLTKRIPLDDYDRTRVLSQVLDVVQREWLLWSQEAAQSCRTLICDEWKHVFWLSRWREWDGDATIYWRKLWSAFLPDIAVPQDVESGKRIREFTGVGRPYAKALEVLRREVLSLLSREGRTIVEFRRLDAPGETGLPFDRAKISLPRATFGYTGEYLPEERPLARVLDKNFLPAF